jgi:hypothetical protein
MQYGTWRAFKSNDVTTGTSGKLQYFTAAGSIGEMPADVIA